jgi:hypothetical protein
MQTKPLISFNENEDSRTRRPDGVFFFSKLRRKKTGFALFAAFGFALGVTGCGSGGYPGGGIASLSSSSIVLDAGQSITVSATISNSEQISWNLSQSGCGSTSCGTLSSSTGTAVTYTAPSGVTTSETLTLTASIPNTKSTQTATITVNPDPTVSGTLSSGTVGSPYSATLTTSGGTAPLTMSLAGGNLPPGLTFNASTGVISGTPTAAGTYNFVVQARDSSNVPYTATANESITIVTAVSPLTVAGGAQPAGVVGSPYSTALQASGGVTPYAWSISSGALPGGLTINSATGVISGVPTTAGSFSFTVQVQDATGKTATAAASIAITAPISAPVLTTTALPNGTVGVPYSAIIGVSGGTAPYSCSIISGTLPAGLTLSGCTVSGTPTTAGTSTVQVKVVDSSNPQQSTTGPESITINPAALSLTTTALPNGQVNVPYSATIGVTGGTSPYNCSIISGTLPAGLTLSGCTVSGTPTTAGTSTVQVKVTDSGNPQQTVTGPETITIGSAALSLTTTTLPNGTVNVPYTATIGVTGGTSPYSCTITSGTLPAGLTLSGCTVSGTPTAAGTSTVQVKVTDASSPQQSTTGPESITISPAQLSLTTTALPNGTVGVAYTATIGISGGTSPYSCAITSGTLPAGLTLSGCTVSGTPTTAGTSTVQVKVTDASSPQQSTTGPESITISPAQLKLTVATLPDGTVNVPYTATIGVSGGTSPYSCAITSGTLPAGLTLSGCTVSGTPTAAGSATVQVKVTDSGNPQQTASGPETITIDAAALMFTTSTLPSGTVNVPYTATIGVTGGISPYSCTIASGTLPAGLTLSGCTISGTPTAAGTSTVQVKVTDSDNPQQSITGPETITINPSGALTLTGTLPNATVGVAYSQNLNATGGKTPYSFSVTSGSLPAGLTLSANGTVSGTPTAAGASTFTVTVTDSSSTPETATNSYTLLVAYPSGPNDGELKGPYAFLFQGYDDVVSGVLSYQMARVGALTANGTGIITSGEQNSNHQTSASTDTTVGTEQLLGTYQINSDNTGMITITTFNANGTANTTHTYAVSLKAPVPPATTYSQGSLIEYDSNQAVGTRGSGILLAQTPSDFAAGLHGSYAFGLSGDTPCLISCTVGLASGPVATVGEFSVASSGKTLSGSADANIASTNFPNAPISGAYQPADADGQVKFTLSNPSVGDGTYPVDYVGYIVNANELLVMSADEHSAYSLLAGTAQQQTESTFSALNGPIIGYENAQVNPSLVGVALSDVLNYSSASIFRSVGNGSGSCNITNADNSGLLGLANGLTSTLGNLLGLSGTQLGQGLLGAYDTTGTTTCPVSSNGRGELGYPQPSGGLLGGLLGSLLDVLFPSGPPAPRVFYLVGPNEGYFMQSDYAGLGYFKPQSGSPFTAASLSGTYVYNTVPAASLASINATGYITFNGSGNANETLDQNVGVGNINLLQLGVTANTTYALSNPNGTDTPANTGRYLLGDGVTVVYAISPTQLVILNTSALQTAPTVSLAY